MVRAHHLLSCVKVAALCGAGLILILSLPSGTVGQDSTPQRGYQPGASYALSDIETLNTNNGNLMLNLPLGKLPAGRGGLSGQLNLHYDSKLYDSHTEYIQDWDHLQNGQPHVAIGNSVTPTDLGGWHYGLGYEMQLIDKMSQYPYELRPQYPDTQAINHWKVKIAFPDGSVHEFLPRGFGTPSTDGFYDIRPDGYQTRWAGAPCCIYADDFPYLNGTLTYYSFDGTYLRLDIQHDSDSSWWNNPWTLYFPDGTKVTNGNKITDRNGNHVEIDDITYNGHPATQLIDQLGRKIVIEGQAISDGQVIHVPGVGGADLTYQVHWKTVQVCKSYSTVINDPYSPQGYPDMIGTLNVVSEIDLPPESGGLKYLFGYNAADYGSVPWGTPSNGWGELNSVTDPSGAQAQYQYHLDGLNGPGTDYTSDVVLKNWITLKNLTYQRQYDGSSTPVTETWNYSDSLQSIINPDGGAVTQVNDAQRNYRTLQPDGTVSEKLWQANVPQGFPSLSAFDQTTGIDAYDIQRVNGYLKTEFTSIRDANGNLTKTAIKGYSYDKNGNVTSVSEYDWVDYNSVPRGGIWGLPTGIPGNAVLKRVTTNSYARWTPDASDSSSNVADSYWNLTSPSIKNAVASSEVSDGSTTLSRTELFYDDPGTTGNLIQQKSWNSTKGGYSNPLSSGNSVSVAHQYDGYGNPVLTTDARGYQTQLVYGNVGGFTDLYATQVKTAFQTAVQRTTTSEYDFYTGLVTRVTDVDNGMSSSTVYDVFGRPTLVRAAENKPEETRTATEYSDADRRVIVRSDLNSLGDGKLVGIRHYDQLGRIRLARQLEDATSQSAYDETQGIKVQMRYIVSNPCQPTDTPECLSTNSATLGSYQVTSNPYRASTSGAASGEATMGWTRSKSNNGGRLVEVQTFGGTVLPSPWGSNSTSTGTVTTAYDANFTTVTDQTGKVRRSMTNGLGQLARVDEPDSNSSLGSTTSPAQPTSYFYDGLGNLVTVNQGSQARSFVYSSLSRLLSATNPESGTTGYQYDANGNLTTKTDPRLLTDNVTHVMVTYVYDALNRAITRSYNDGTPGVTYAYDSGSIAYAKGRLVSVSSTASSYSYSAYDALGRVTGGTETVGSQGYTVGYSYDKAGHVLTETYPSGRIVTNTYDGAGRANSVTGNLGDGSSRNYATGIVYDAGNRMTQEQFGTTIPIYNKLFYNSRGQLAEIRDGLTGNSTNWERGAIISHYSDTCWGMCSGLSMTDNNGNLKKQEHWIQDGNGTVTAVFTQQYGYDSLNRIQRVHDGSNWQQQYSYDSYGNRTIDQTNTFGTGIPKPNFTVNTANNRLGVPNGQSGTMSYDNAGNLTTDTYSATAVTRAYDAENRMTSETQANNYVAGSYSYDGDGRRVVRNVNGVVTWQAYGLSGELLAEYAQNGSPASPQKEYGYRNGQLLVTLDGASSGSSSENVAWTNVVGVSASGNNLTKTAATGWGNAGAVSTRNIVSGDGYVECTVNATNTDWLIGLSHGDTDQNWTDVDFAFNPAANSNLYIYEFGVQKGNFGSYAVGDVLRVAVEGGVVKYRRNGTLIYTSATAPTYPLLVDTSFNQNGSSLSNAVVSGNFGSGSSSTQIHWLVTDQLGTPRMIFDQSGALATVSRHDYLPFGEELFAGTGGRTVALGYTNNDGARQKFTQKERDNETGLDYFNARYYASTQGRFTSPDEFSGGPDELFEFEKSASDNPTFYADIADPQSLNKYQYAYNNPLRFVDADGHQGTELVKSLVRCASDTQIAVDKVGLNLVIGAQNIGADAVGVDRIQPLQANGVCQDISMRVGNGVALVSSVIGGRGPANVFVAETKTTTAISTETASARAASAEAREVDAVAGSSNAARREAMRERGIPTSQQPSSQVISPHGNSYEYQVSAPGGGRTTGVVTNDPRPMSVTNQHGPHWEAGVAKSPVRRDPTGRLRMQNKDKVRVAY